MRLLIRRKDQRQALRLARLLVELDDVARERRRAKARRSLGASLGGAR